jgi:hypothetical protein
MVTPRLSTSWLSFLATAAAAVIRALRDLSARNDLGDVVCRTFEERGDPVPQTIRY